MEKYIVKLFGVVAVGQVEVEAESLQEAVVKAQQHTQVNPAALQSVQPFIFPIPAKLTDLEAAKDGHPTDIATLQVSPPEERKPKLWTPGQPL
jgi:hypothetical protein